MTFTATAIQTLTTHKYKLTTQRRQIIDILAKNKKPLNPYDIAKQTSNTINVATVYRTMQLFEELGLVHKIRSIDGYIACTASCHPEQSEGSRKQNTKHCHHYAVCTNCHCVQEMHNLSTEGGHHHTHPLPENFHSDNQVFELTGKCKKCL